MILNRLNNEIMDAQEYIDNYKKEDLIHSLNFEGDLMASEKTLVRLMEAYHEIKVENLGLFGVRQQSELLIAFVRWARKEYEVEELFEMYVEEFLRESNL